MQILPRFQCFLLNVLILLFPVFFDCYFISFSLTRVLSSVPHSQVWQCIFAIPTLCGNRQEGSEVQGHPLPQHESKASLATRDPVLKNKNKKKTQKTQAGGDK